MNAAIFIKELWRGKDLYRTLMNIECAAYEVGGMVLDLGGGTGAASYNRFLKILKEAEIVSLDGIAGTSVGRMNIDLEKDRLPYADGSIDTVLAFNILEHIYDHEHLVAEARRVLHPGGTIIGAVPFLVGYHPDPHDYWRYTDETLKKIFEARGFKNIKIKILGRGPFCAAYSQIEFMIPRFIKIFFLPVVLALDAAVFAIRPQLRREKFALGSFFSFHA